MQHDSATIAAAAGHPVGARDDVACRNGEGGLEVFGRSGGSRRRRSVGVVHAHSGTHSYAYVIVSDGSVTGNVQFPIDALNGVLSLALPNDRDGALAAMGRHRKEIEAYAREHLSLASGGRPWDLRFTGHRVLEHKAGSYAILDYEIGQPPDPALRRFIVTYDGIMHAQPHHEALVIVRTSAGLGRLRSTEETRLTFSPGRTSQEIGIAEESTWNNVSGAARYVTKQGRRLAKGIRKRVARALSDS